MNPARREEKAALEARLKADVEAFLAAGGRISEVSHGATSKPDVLIPAEYDIARQKGTLASRIGKVSKGNTKGDAWRGVAGTIPRTKGTGLPRPGRVAQVEEEDGDE